MALIKIPAGSHGIVYVRVSTEHQASDELPIASQVAELTAAVEHAGATCDVVQDAGISGTDLEGRQGLQSIISRAREGGPSFSWVLVWKFSRFTRTSSMRPPRPPTCSGPRRSWPGRATRRAAARPSATGESRS
jgi:hypothetical protein